MKRTTIPPVEAPRIVLTIANATTSPSPTFEIDPCKQTLNSYQYFKGWRSQVPGYPTQEPGYPGQVPG